MRTIKELLENNTDRHEMTEEELKLFINYWFDKYESTGFCKTFSSPFDLYDVHKPYIGKPFKVVARYTEAEVDLESLPMWEIEFDDGFRMQAYPEEICLIEQGYIDFSETTNVATNKNKPGLYEVLFDEFLDLIEFTLIKVKNGWQLKDRQEGNLNDIESCIFSNAAELIESLDRYIDDYLVRAITECLPDIDCNQCWGDVAIQALTIGPGDSFRDVQMLDMLCNHFDEIDLEKCCYEILENA